jgi:hypothetical protein
MYGARFPTEIYTRGCHWIPRMFASSEHMRVANGIPLGSSLLLPVCTVNCVQTLKAIGVPLILIQMKRTRIKRSEIEGRRAAYRSKQASQPTAASPSGGEVATLRNRARCLLCGRVVAFGCTPPPGPATVSSPVLSPGRSNNAVLRGTFSYCYPLKPCHTTEGQWS